MSSVTVRSPQEKREISVTSLKARIALLSFVTPDFVQRWRKSIAMKNCYCSIHGYHHILHPITSEGKNIHWTKPEAILQFLPFFDVVFFLDSDTYILNFSIPLESFIRPQDHVVISDEDMPPFLAGMIMVRNSPEGEGFVRDWMRKSSYWKLDSDNGGLIQTILDSSLKDLTEAQECEACAGEKSGECSFGDHGYSSFNKCIHAKLSKAIGKFEHRKHKFIRFLPPLISWSRFAREDLSARASLNLFQDRPYRHVKKGDFLVHARYTEGESPFVNLKYVHCKIKSQRQTQVLVPLSGVVELCENPEHVDAIPPRSDRNVLSPPSSVDEITFRKPKLVSKTSLIKRQVGDFWTQQMEITPSEDREVVFRELVSGRIVLHVGCTDWPIFKKETNLHIKLSRFAKRIDCLDPDENGLENMKQYVKNGEFYSSSEQANNQRYDVVIVPETIEHVPNIALFLGALMKLKFKDFIITGPNIALNPRATTFHFKQEGNIFTERVHPDHKIWLTPYTLANTLEQYAPEINITNIYFFQERLQVAVRGKMIR